MINSFYAVSSAQILEIKLSIASLPQGRTVSKILEHNYARRGWSVSWDELLRICGTQRGQDDLTPPPKV